MKRITLTILLSLAIPLSGSIYAQGNPHYDIVIYGGTSAAVIAAVQAKKMGHSIIIVCPDIHLGGLTSGGLGWTDTGNKTVIGGLARDFYHRVWKYYQMPETWKWQKREEFGNKGQGTVAMDGDARTMWIFEPSIAEKVFEDYIREFDIPVVRNAWLDRESGVEMSNGKIRSIKTLAGKKFAGSIFMDTTYEGDLLAAAGIDYHVGREGNDVYGEEWNGVQTGVNHHGHHFATVSEPISPYVIPHDPSSGTLPRISAEHPGVKGQGDHRVQAYCFRMCLSNHPENRIPFPKPEEYDPSQYELLVRIYDAGWRHTFQKYDVIPNHKTDTNNHGPFSTDNIGMNYDYPEASYERRREIFAEHENYQKGLLYFMANDERIPKDVQDEMRTWGLPKDEFTDNGNWPHQLYIREARRMIGDYIMTENELRKKRPTPKSVGMGSYSIDSHNVQRYIASDGSVQNEGDIGVSTNGPYEIAYGSLTPKKEQCENLLVPVCVSSSHIAFGSIRMEPVFMILGQSAATAASIALKADIPVQDVKYESLRKRLLSDGQVLEYDGPATRVGHGSSVSLKDLDGIVIDNRNARLTGNWNYSHSSSQFVGLDYAHDGNAGDGMASATFETIIGHQGVYQVLIAYPFHPNRASNVKVEIHCADGIQEVVVNQKIKPPQNDLFYPLGEFEFEANRKATVVVSNKGTDGYVAIDAVQWLKQED